MTSRARDIANFGDGIATADIDDGAVTAGKIGSLPAGSVLQVVSATTTTETSTNSTSFVDTTLTASITPSNASSKVLVIMNPYFYVEENANSIEMRAQITRNSTGIATFNRVLQIRATKDSTILGIGAGRCLTHIDSPSSTTSVTYTLQISAQTATRSARINKDNSPTSSIILMEIAG